MGRKFGQNQTMKYFLTFCLLALNIQLSFSHYNKTTGQFNDLKLNDTIVHFNYTSFDLGTFYFGEQPTVQFPIENLLNKGINIEIKDSWNGHYELFEVEERWKTEHWLKAHQKDVIAFVLKDHYNPDRIEGERLQKFSIYVKDYGYVAVLSIKYELKRDLGKLEADPIQLPNTKEGEIVNFSTKVTNTGTQPITVFYDADQNTDLENLDAFPLVLQPGASKDLFFNFNTADKWHQYDGFIKLDTDRPSRNNYCHIPLSCYIETDSFPQISFDSLVLTRNINQYENCEFFFYFENTGNRPLIIRTAKASCGCVIPTYPREPIMPGERSLIKVKYDSKRIGPINKSVTIYSNATNSILTIKIKGYVKPVSQQSD